VNDGGTNVTGGDPRIFLLKWSLNPQNLPVIRFGTGIFWTWKSLTTFRFIAGPDGRLLRICDWAGCRCLGVQVNAQNFGPRFPTAEAVQETKQLWAKTLKRQTVVTVVRFRW
jgi:hypothetical protein